jgi:CBS domain containing-hemolysin-like protein
MYESLTTAHAVSACGLLLGNAFFVCAEFALLSMRRSKLTEWAKEQRPGANGLLALLEHLDLYLSTCQAGVTLCSLALGWVGGYLLAGLVQGSLVSTGLAAEAGAGLILSIGCGFLLAAFVQVLLAQLMPQTLASHYPEETALWLARPLHVAHILLRPVVWLLHGGSIGLLSLVGLKPSLHPPPSHSDEELRVLLDEYRKAGEISPEERRMLDRVFRFHEKKVMVPTPDIVGVDIRTSFDDMLQKIEKEGYSRLPVYRETLDNIEGIVYVKDLIFSLNHPKLIKLADLVRDPLMIQETAKVSDVLKEFQRRRVHMAIVIDEYSCTSGLVTLEDIVEEIVGEIHDEHDDDEPVEVERRMDGAWLIECKASVDRFRETFPETPLPDGEFDTVGGLVIALAENKLPKQGDSFTLGRLRIRVVQRDGRRLRKVLVQKLPSGSQSRLPAVADAHAEATPLAVVEAPVAEASIRELPGELPHEAEADAADDLDEAVGLVPESAEEGARKH